MLRAPWGCLEAHVTLGCRSRNISDVTFLTCNIGSVLLDHVRVRKKAPEHLRDVRGLSYPCRLVLRQNYDTVTPSKKIISCS